MHTYFVYILASRRNGSLYVGVTIDIRRRLFEHRNSVEESHTKKYNLSMLVYYECTDDIQIARARENQLKGWKRAKKIHLIETVNPHWHDLLATLSF